MTDQRPPLAPDPLTVDEAERQWRAYRAEPQMVVVPMHHHAEHSPPPLISFLVVALTGAIVGALLAWTLAPRVDAASPAGAEPSRRPARLQPEAPQHPGVEDRRLASPAAEVPPPLATISTLRGRATWYCGRGSACTRGYSPADLVAAIDPTLGIDKGTRLTVSSGGRSVTVTVVDVCACAGPRVIDLTSGAFRRLAPLSRGTIPVTLWSRAPALPATDVAP